MKIFVLLSRFPYPLEKGDKLRAYHQIKELSKNHQIILCALNIGKIHPKAIEKLQDYCQEIKIIQLSRLNIPINLFLGLLFSKYPLQVAYFYNKSAKRKILELIDKLKPDHIYCQLIRVSEYVKHIDGIPKTLDYMDALSSGMERRIQAAPFYMRLFFKIESLRLKRYEHFIFNHFDNKTIISAQDRQLIVNAKNEDIHIISNGVDQEYFHPNNTFEKQYELIFTGNMSYPPNVLGVEYIAKEILPLIQQNIPNCRLVIAGVDPSARVKSLSSENVLVTGWVEDIRKYYWQSKVFIAPMNIGTGLQNKLLEAMSMRIPCITSTLANNALSAVENEEILIGYSPEDYAEKVIFLLKDTNFANRIADNAFDFIARNYDWTKSCKKLEKIFTQT